MSLNFAYNYAYIDPTTHQCLDYFSQSAPMTDPDILANLVETPVNDPEYLFKYYINGAWYEDAEGTIPWTSSLL